jgi:hypothetical protein
MSYPIQEYKPNNNAVVDQQLDRALFNDYNDDDIVRSFFGLANRMMREMLRTDGLSSFASSDPNNPNVKVFGISSMNVTQISRGPDGRPHIVQAHDERRMGPGGVWQTKKALRDPDRGIDKMQVGYFVGNQGEIIERQLDPTSGQYRKEIKRRGLPSNELNFSNQWRTSAQQAMQQPPPLPQQQLPSYYNQYPQQALPAPASYNQYSQQPLSYDPYPQQSVPASLYQYY